MNELNSHPLTLIIGGICLVILVIVLALGLTCAAYESDGRNFSNIKDYRDFAAETGLCKK